MSTDMTGIYFEPITKEIEVSLVLSEINRYFLLTNILPWEKLAEIANFHRSKEVNIHLGRTLDLRLHLGAYLARYLNGWNDRQTEEMIRCHSGMRVLCGLHGKSTTLDRTSVQSFRSQLGKDGAEAINHAIVLQAKSAGFTGSELCAADTTVQESPIAHPTEVGHMKKISEKLIGIGKKLGGKIEKVVTTLGKKVQEIFTEIRLFTKGVKEKTVERKKVLSTQMHKLVSSMSTEVKEELFSQKIKVQEKYQGAVDLYQKILDQSIIWIKTGKHPANKLLSLWELSARSIQKGKVGKSVEFGRRWIITRLLGGYIIGAPCVNLGSDSDANIADEVLINFLNVFGELPESFVFDRGGDGENNHKLLEDFGIQNNCIFKKGSEKMNVSEEVFEMARSQRALNEASIATLKCKKYNFTKPNARSTDSCILNGHTAMLGANLNNLLRDVYQTIGMKVEIT